MPSAQRLDAALVARGLSPSRTAARKAIEAGRVSVRRSGHPSAEAISKPAATVDTSDEIFLQAAPEDAWVSRGALKLIGALDVTGIDPSGVTALDVGQSTGGFTDVLLQRGARHVTGVDVGHGQLHERLRSDSRVSLIEGFNARDISMERLQAAAASVAQNASGMATIPASGFDLIVIDVSFISLLKISAGLKTLMARGGQGLWLVKPQFEVGPAHIGKGGLVKPDAIGPAFEKHISDSLAAQGFCIKQFLPSPITGGDGNREFFVWVCPES